VKRKLRKSHDGREKNPGVGKTTENSCTKLGVGVVISFLYISVVHSQLSGVVEVQGEINSPS